MFIMHKCYQATHLPVHVISKIQALRTGITFYLFFKGRVGDRKKKKFPFADSLPQSTKQPMTSQFKARNQESYLDTISRFRDPDAWPIICCLLGCALQTGESKVQEGFHLWHSIMQCEHLWAT